MLLIWEFSITDIYKKITEIDLGFSINKFLNKITIQNININYKRKLEYIYTINNINKKFKFNKEYIIIANYFYNSISFDNPINEIIISLSLYSLIL